jgi:hypothetical protein
METKFKFRLPFMKNSRAAKNAAAAHKTRIGKDPYFDWTVILASFIAVAVLCVSFALALWYQVSSGSAISAGDSETTSAVSGPTLNSAALQKITTIESAKSETAAQYQKGYPGPADPSM